MVSALDSRSSGLGMSSGQFTAFCPQARHLTLTVPFSTHEYKWVLENCWGNLTEC